MKSIIQEAVWPQAVFCANDYMAAGALKYLRSRNRVDRDRRAGQVVGQEGSKHGFALDLVMVGGGPSPLSGLHCPIQ